MLLRIRVLASDDHGAYTAGEWRRKVVLNLSRGYRPVRIVERDVSAGTRTETDIELERLVEAGVWMAKRVHQRVLAGDGPAAELRKEVIYEFSEFTPRTHIRFRHP